jgi:hypothetical protein
MPIRSRVEIHIIHKEQASMNLSDLNVTGVGIVGGTAAASGAGAKPASNAASASTAGSASSAQSAASAKSAATLLNAVYTTTVGGKRYSGNISHANGVYTISVPNVPGATVTAASLQAAEAELYIRIDELV